MRFLAHLLLGSAVLIAVGSCSASRAPDASDAAVVTDATLGSDSAVGCGESYETLTFAFPSMPAVSVCASLNAEAVQAAYRVQRLSGGGFTPCQLYAAGVGTLPVDTPYGPVAFGFGNEGTWLTSPTGAPVRVWFTFTFPDGGPCGGRNCVYQCSLPDGVELEIIRSSATPGDVFESRLRVPCTLANAADLSDRFVPSITELYVHGVVTARTSLLVGGFTEPTTETTCP